MQYTNKQGAVWLPYGDAEAPYGKSAIYLAGAGTTEASTPGALTVHKMYSITVGAVPIRISLRNAGGLSNAVATTDLIIPAYTTREFVVGKNPNPSYGSTFVYVEAADGSSSYEAWVYESSRG